MPDMIAASDRLEFAPPTPPGFGRALILALLAHLLLVAALTWGVHWKSEPVTLSAEAELWSAVPKEAAPRSVGAAPEPPPKPKPEPEPEKIQPPAPPIPPPAPPPEPPQVSEADIALEKEKLLLKKAEEKKRLQEKQRLEKLKREKLAEEKELLEKKALDKKLAEKKLQDKREQEKKVAEEKKLAEEKLEKKLKAQELERQTALEAKEDAKRMEAQRQANLKRMAGLAGATGSATATGKDLQSSGPSSGYAGRVRARIKPNIVFTEDISTNPVTEVDVRTSPDGTIISRKIIKPSGVPSWDEAVLRAIDKTESLPKDTNGLVPQSLVIVFRPKD